jgi:ABC-type branched-subunit amino acid transport system permease subunit
VSRAKCLSWRQRALITLFFAARVLAPLVADRYLVSVLTLILYFVYVGQAWNLMMGYGGQLSLGHAPYVGLGAYVAALLWVCAGIGPWLGVSAAILIAMIVLAPIVGGLGTIFGPVIGAFVLTPLGESLITMTERFGINTPGVKTVFYGAVLIVIIYLRPSGVWPWLARVLGVSERKP